MNKNEYLVRVFESQINSLTNQLKSTLDEITEIEFALKELKLDYAGTQELLTYAENEMRKLK